MVKVNISFTYLHVNVFLIVFKKRYALEKKINFFDTRKIIKRYKSPEERQKFKKHLNYYRQVKKIFKLFYVKNLFIYPECISEAQTFAVEFEIVNRMLKKSLLNG